MIKLLSKETIDKIAAGEVVERPENVAKELIENSIDSGAKAISVEIRGGGLDLIRVTDNGCGISREDLPNAFVRHATSKLETAEDLSHIRTMGFRGEALASIAGVSRVELITKRPEDLNGYRYVIEGGREIELKEVGIPAGTTIIIRDLFFNVPVRRQFLKSAKTEGSYVRDIVEKAALAHPEISFSMISDGKQQFHTTGSGKLRDVIYTIYGNETLSELLPVSFETKQGRISGFISKPTFSRSRRDSEIFFVNDRFIKSSVIERAVETAYEGYLMQHRFPFTVLAVELQPEQVDVNIHPKKTEVRFSNDEAVFDLLFDGVKYILQHREHIADALHKEEKTPTEKQIHAEPFERSKNVSVQQGLRADASAVDSFHPEAGVSGSFHSKVDASDRFHSKANATDSFQPEATTDESCRKVQYNSIETGNSEASHENGSGVLKDKTTTNANPLQQIEVLKTVLDEIHQSGRENGQLGFLNQEAEKNYRFIGQIFDTYWLIEYENALYVIDQHAAHEKVNYEELMQKVRSSEVTSQSIIPVLLTLPARLSALLEDHLDEFAAVGFEIEPVGDHDFAVRTVPAYLPELDKKELLMEMIEGLEEYKPGQDPERLKEKIASMSCKAAVKGNRRLSEPEMKELTRRLMKLEDPYHCPHGRPVMVKFSKNELDRMFKRIV